MGRIRIIIYLSILLGILSCSNRNNVAESPKLTQKQVNEELVLANKVSVELENKQIDSLIRISGWNMLKTSTGLRYEILAAGKGPKAKTGELARFEYEVKLISGELIYSSEQTGPKEFRIGSGGVESGLEEAILLLRVGDHVRLIMPSYLAHGLSGDQNRIPPKATLIYTLKLIELK